MGIFTRMFGSKQSAPEPVAEPGTLRIECVTTFLDGAVRYEAGDVRSVPLADAHRFIAQGWAQPVGGTSLDVHNSTIGVGDTNG